MITPLVFLVSNFHTLGAFLPDRTRLNAQWTERKIHVAGAPGLGLQRARIYFQLPRSVGLLNRHTFPSTERRPNRPNVDRTPTERDRTPTELTEYAHFPACASALGVCVIDSYAGGGCVLYIDTYIGKYKYKIQTPLDAGACAGGCGGRRRAPQR